MPSTKSYQVRLANLKETILLPDFIHMYFEQDDLPEQPSLLDIAKIGQAVLLKKIEEIDLANLERPKRLHKRLPDKLEIEDMATVMMLLFDFRNIQLSEQSRKDTVLGMYVENKNDANYGTYVVDEPYMKKLIRRVSYNMKPKDIDDIIKTISNTMGTVKQTKEQHLFPVKNGIYNKKTRTLEDFSPDYIYLTKIPVDYKFNPINPKIQMPDGEIWDVETWIEELAISPNVAILIWQVIADCIQPNRPRFKSIWFYSEKGNNGKGTIGQLIKNLLGKGNYASLAVTDFNHEFMKDSLMGVAANIADENDVETYIDSVKDYKASITGDDINVNRKYEKPLRLQFLGTNIQMMNGLPKTKDKSESFYRRLILVPFTKSFTNNGERSYIKSDYIHRQDVLEYVLYKTINMDFDEFIIPIESALLLNNYKERNNPVLDFWNEKKEEFQWGLLPVPFLYRIYQDWFEENNPSGKIIGKRTFLESLTAVIQAGEEPWEYKKKVRPSGRMDEDEPLITEHGLDKPDKNGKQSPWVNSNYKGTNPKDLRDFERKDYYAGFIRL